MARKPAHFGRWLADLRKARGLSQDQLCGLSGLSKETIGRQERMAEPAMRPGNLAQLAQALHRAGALEAGEIAHLRRSGLPPGTEFGGGTVLLNGQPAGADLADRYAGQLRQLVERIHAQLVAEAAARDYLDQLLLAADRLGVRLDLTDPRATPTNTSRAPTVRDPEST